MSKLESIKIEYIKKFLLLKGYLWRGKIKDNWKMVYRDATIEDFNNNRMVRLVVKTKNYDKMFIQRVIVSDSKFKIENLSLKKMDCFESFNEEWVEFLNTKCIKKEPKPETVSTQN